MKFPSGMLLLLLLAGFAWRGWDLICCLAWWMNFLTR